MRKIDLKGLWKFKLDQYKLGMPTEYEDTIELPGTTSYRSKGVKNDMRETYFLTDEYPFEGYAWFEKEILVDDELVGHDSVLHLERTRKTSLWFDGEYIGSCNSLTTPHRYALAISRHQHVITLCVDNTDYPTKGGHMTSQDTQTNWNGITGAIELQFLDIKRLEDIQIYTELSRKSIRIKATLKDSSKDMLKNMSKDTSKDTLKNSSKDTLKDVSKNEAKIESERAVTEVVRVYAESLDGTHSVATCFYKVCTGNLELDYYMGDDAVLWSEFNPFLYRLTLEVVGGEVTELIMGLREFKADRDKFTINGIRTFLRGKHDGLIFPETGFAPTTVEKWLEVLSTAKEYGINHYRFHTCCPPEAAFVAADILGIYMQPELPFWGTVTGESDENHNQVQFDYLVSEGFAMLKTFGNHPSFVMMSLGNELWGNKEVLNKILKDYKKADSRHLYTQGSNNFQFVPNVLPEDDFFSGVRFSHDRLIRGSYAMCDAPLGHIQTMKPSTLVDYDRHFFPQPLDWSELDESEFIQVDEIKMEDKLNEADETTARVEKKASREIQFGTQTKKVEMTMDTEEFFVTVPVVTHEIGQYQTFPDFKEIGRYTGPLKARNFECFKERLEEKGLGDLSESYFINSGKFAMDCYKEELEAAHRSKQLAGYQILDIQDFSGQGTALVGVLNAFMESKGLISDWEWRQFCADMVLLARFADYNQQGGNTFETLIQLSNYRILLPMEIEVHWALMSDDRGVFAEGSLVYGLDGNTGTIDIGEIRIQLPAVETMTVAKFSLRCDNVNVSNTYEIYIYPSMDMDVHAMTSQQQFSVTQEWIETEKLLEQGKKVLFFPSEKELSRSLEGFYCTDFWCYPMFRSISESVKKPIPVGTLGLLINNKHAALQQFVSKEYSTPQWWSIVNASRALILDETPVSFRPIIQTIDNFERNHKLGMLFECNVGDGALLVCTCKQDLLLESIEGRQFLHSLMEYCGSDEFHPASSLEKNILQQLFKHSF